MFLNAKLLKNSRGATIIEYALIVALISVCAIAFINSVGQKVASIFSLVADKLNTAKSGGNTVIQEEMGVKSGGNSSHPEKTGEGGSGRPGRPGKY